MTIAEAAREILRRAERPMTVDEIYNEIVAAGLAEFKAAHPRSVLRNQIRRHCEGVPHASSTQTKYFTLAGTGVIVYSTELADSDARVVLQRW